MLITALCLKKVHLFYSCDIFVKFRPILLIFGKNIAQETWNKDMYTTCSHLILYVCAVLHVL